MRTIETEGTPDRAYGDNSGAIEWYLDSQASTGMAPDVKQLDFYFSKGFQDADIAQEFNYWANDPNGPREMNASFGECEQNPTEPVTGGPLSDLPAGVGLGGDAEALSDPALRQAALEGRTLFTSAGDTGSGCPSIYAPVLGAGNGLAVQPVPFQNYPCISDYVVCVGGTVVSSPAVAIRIGAAVGSDLLDLQWRRHELFQRGSVLPAGDQGARHRLCLQRHGHDRLRARIGAAVPWRPGRRRHVG